MGWVRRYGRRYYYRGHRDGDRVVSEYLGTGTEARLAAALTQKRKEQQATDRLLREQARQTWDTAAGPTSSLAEVCRLLLHAALLVEGYHQHHRGEWRRRLESKDGGALWKTFKDS